MLDMRIRLPELLEECRTNAHALSVASGGRLAPNTVYKLIAKQGVVRYLDAGTLQAIYQTLKLESMDQLLSPNPPPPHRAKAKRRR